MATKIEISKKKIPGVQKKKLAEVKKINISDLATPQKKSTINGIVKNLEEITGKRSKKFKIEY